MEGPVWSGIGTIQCTWAYMTSRGALAFNQGRALSAHYSHHCCWCWWWLGKGWTDVGRDLGSNNVPLSDHNNPAATSPASMSDGRWGTSTAVGWEKQLTRIP